MLYRGREKNKILFFSLPLDIAVFLLVLCKQNKSDNLKDNK